MSDVLFTKYNILQRFKDMGDTTYAKVVAANLVSGGSVVSGTNPLPVEPDGVMDGSLYSGSVTGTGVLWWGPASGYKSGTFTTTAVGSGIQIVAEGSNNTTNGTDGSWSAIPLATITSSVTSGVGGLFGAGSMEFLIHHAFVRIRLASGTGTTSGALVLKRGQTTFYGRVGIDSGNQTIGNVNVSTGLIDTTTALGSSATFTGTARIMGNNAMYSWYTVTAFADVAGTLYIEWSLDNGATYQTFSSVAVSAGTTQQLSCRPPATVANSLLRAKYVNGASAQTTFRLATQISAN